jgi:RimJ/RimL family protein N-acetyltransferase
VLLPLLPLTTERLALRALTEDDLDDHLRLFGDPSVVRYLYDEVIETRQAAAVHLARRLNPQLPPAEGVWFNLAVTRSGNYLGEVGASLRNAEHRQCEVGYILLPEAQGHGYATEAAAAMVAYCFGDLNAHRVAARLDARNTASAAVAQRLGMRLEAHIRENEWVKGEWTDEAVYAMTEDEFRSRAARP